jgi:hypothetical protein
LLGVKETLVGQFSAGKFEIKKSGISAAFFNCRSG